VRSEGWEGGGRKTVGVFAGFYFGHCSNLEKREEDEMEVKWRKRLEKGGEWHLGGAEADVLVAHDYFQLLKQG
jgi:hypothetical protein